MNDKIDAFNEKEEISLTEMDYNVKKLSELTARLDAAMSELEVRHYCNFMGETTCMFPVLFEVH